MQKTITVCDVCNAPTTREYADGDTYEIGHKLRIRAESGTSFPLDAPVELHTTRSISCGTSSSGTTLLYHHYCDFCSDQCLLEYLRDTLTRVEQHIKQHPQRS